MAKATKITETVTQEVTKYTLELSEAERNSLASLLMGVGNPNLVALRVALSAPQDPETPSPAPLAVGDRVRVTDHGWYEGCEGTLRTIDDVDDGIPYLVDVDNNEGPYWASRVERTSA